MRRRRGLAQLTCVTSVLLASAVGVAQPEDSAVAAAPASTTPGAAEAVETGYAALPGGLHVAAADDVPAGQVVISALAGFGYRKGLLGPAHRFGRGIGDLAVAFAPIPHLALALALDGRYDRHYGLAPSGDDGYVGDPRLLARYTLTSGSVHVGGQVGVWVPGKTAPSVAGSAISVDARAFATLAAGPGRLSLDVGYRLDNSARSVDDLARLSLQDRVSLGVSDFNEVFGGVRYAIPVAAGKAYVGLEASIEAFVGSSSTAALAEGSQLLRGTVTAGYRVAPEWTLMAFVEGVKSPGIESSQITAGAIPIVPYEPVLTGGVGLQAHFGGPHRGATSTVTANVHPRDVEIVEYADVTGQVGDDTGGPVVGATVTITLKDHTGTGATDEKGVYAVTKLPIGRTVGGATTLDDAAAAISVEVDGKKPGRATMVLAKGANLVPKIVLDPVLPPGQLRGIVKSLASGKPIPNAQITVTPGGMTITSGVDGTFQLDLAPGSYRITVTAPNLAKQELDVTIDPNGVSLKNIDMHK